MIKTKITSNPDKVFCLDEPNTYSDETIASVMLNETCSF